MPAIHYVCVPNRHSRGMSVVLLSALAYTRNMEPMLFSRSQVVSHISQGSLNTTISCVLNGVEYFILSPSPDTINCENISMISSAHERSVVSIIWSCLATLFTCTWVSLHSNIPHSDATEWHIRRHRIIMVVYGLIAPELIVLLALRQWFGARVLVRKMRGARQY